MKKGLYLAVTLALLLTGCSNFMDTPDAEEYPTLAPRGAIYKDLINLPLPKGKIMVSVYDFRDQTGQYKDYPSSTFATAVPQGGTSMLTSSLLDSKWFLPLEREGLQNLLTERKIIRAAQKKDEAPVNIGDDLPALKSANLVIEGGIIGYESDLKSGGHGIGYFGLATYGEYRMDQVTVNLRAVDVRTGQILLSVTTSKTIFSHALSGSVFRYIAYQDLLEMESGYTNNEPVNIAVMSAIDSAVIHMIIDGIQKGLWEPADKKQMESPVMKRYMQESTTIL
ncbi:MULTISPECIES: CsgG/HfaB family protein [Vibrio]|jgi:curli production assembly/transport component CsgG|uniref:Curli production assembly/transport component CsgG n=2 Tax=Vibrio TaxID=662 RepID=A0A2J8H5R4_VIBDI|nr:MULTISPECIES: CsgG/HfaB family protein [Vibrio]MCF7362152.1 curli production assembly/transport protein CsgG [Vibrio sp. A1-b2]MCZ4370394.1 curli production assembly/transport protein CsgG [Vibrio diazotrophicus]MDW6019785.1 CsgG/HfaB family protein [Vibrio plantisponsor]NNM38885.1 curli production assembly/transport protein CsgG [Vibrio plantisponsor]PNH79150.1 curli production assembly/transport protein CsgG [Vibrio diazotrophicus]